MKLIIYELSTIIILKKEKSAPGGSVPIEWPQLLVGVLHFPTPTQHYREVPSGTDISSLALVCPFPHVGEVSLEFLVLPFHHVVKEPMDPLAIH